MATSTRGENVYLCDTCARRARVPENKQGMDVLRNCNITLGCLGKLSRVFNVREINLTPAVPPEVNGVEDWYQRRSLYTHTQTISGSTWLIEHDLANKPVIHAYVIKLVDGVNTLVSQEPTAIKTIDLNNTSITFDTSYSGTAQCISLSTQNITNPNAVDPLVVAPETMQLTSDVGEITIATLNSDITVSLTLTYITPEGNASIDYIQIDNVVSIDSPWVNVSQAIIAGRKYTIRSFNLSTTPLAPASFIKGLIPNGTGFFVSAINGIPFTAGQILLLLGTRPYASVDRVLDKYVDAFYVDHVSPQTLYDTGKGYVLPSILKTTYPLILVVG